MNQVKVGRRAGMGIAVLACALALGGPAALAYSTSHSGAQATKKVGPGNTARGYIVFSEQTFCYACHTLKAGGPYAYGELGTNLDEVRVPYAIAKASVELGVPAALPAYPTQMVPFKNALTAAQVKDVSTFVATYSKTYKTCTPLSEDAKGNGICTG